MENFELIFINFSKLENEGKMKKGKSEKEITILISFPFSDIVSSVNFYCNRSLDVYFGKFYELMSKRFH